MVSVCHSPICRQTEPISAQHCLCTISTKHPSAHKTGNVENHHFDNHRLAGMSFEDMIVDLAGMEQHEAMQQL